ncbi:signal transduction histidine kinase/CheY-like chemotaxis protein [Granulicella aggregans]|uniref:histidine kinase n=1 Tax=Granulicella aggregans TaxID=474949 RepID=A0A7W8E1R8_9BACT|nr:ATP-binding protein [Granulicella aggregans]MBB5055712.1 signal transduction histidine kinase/CheY-like chemotaxis protein [Granulicella aggregans]
MVISIPAPTAVVLLILLLIIGILVGVLVQTRRKSSELRVRLDAARQRQQEDERELTQRSALDTLKDEFVSTVSHELRTPLTSIRGALGLLSSGVFGNLDVKSQNLLRIALTNTDRLIRLINDLLDLERMDSGAAVLQMRRCSLPELVNQAMETMSALADAGQVKLLVSPGAKALMPNVFFDADPDRILQVLTNLFSNAIKFAPASSSVTFEVETPPDELIFRVVDQGRGIPEDQLESIFERFKQVDHPDARAIGGTGLGLAICRSIIQQHGGSIWAQRNVAKGASICIRLPRHQRTYDASVGGAYTASIEVPSIVAAPRPDTVLDTPILICDDNKAKRTLIVTQLRARGHCVLEAGSSDEAIEIAKNRPAQSPVRAILLDLQMSDMKRWEILKLLTRNGSTASIPVVCLSMGAEADDALQSPNALRPTSSPSLLSEDYLFAELSHALLSDRGPGRVLLVEDDLDLANVVLGGFAKTNVLVEHAATLYRAKVLCRERRPDLLILDLTLPDGDGFSLVEWLRSLPELASLPLIVYSGRELEEGDQSKLRLGPTKFLTKARVQSRDLELLVLTMVPQGRGNNKSDPEDRGGQQRSTGLPVS